jgi:hypothetical protein
MVIVVAIILRVLCLNPAESNGFLRAIKIRIRLPSEEK